LQAALDPTDTHVLSLTQNALHVFRLREGTLAARLSGTCRYTHFSASVLETSKVAIGTTTGTVDIWDLSSQSKVGSLSPHTGAVTGVAFSSVSKLLLASASVDQTLVFSDTASGKTIQRMELGSPAFSLTFHDDGLTCAVGTESKCVLVYDLRQPNDAMARYQANDVITCVSFAPGGSTANIGRTKSKRRQATLLPEKPTMNYAEQKDELGHVVEPSVPNRSLDSIVTTTTTSERHNVPISASLDKVRNRNECKRLGLICIPSSTQHRLIFAQTVKSAVREMIQEELEAMRDEMEEAMRNLHVDLLRQVQVQSQEYSDLISNLTQENEKLREQNEFLKQASSR
jgi:WD40 repeat protein